ncbi:MAG: GntR family transcriptional regulator [Gammaproteobacteria bacterium]|jgi:DNA-binding GntR family transcriptional regulator|nr:GntR family transcriptional regulator [Gammaproteobacteria bacterium]MBT3489192.1 GntR family transcriptional regulator [Gammaproteobacteria bacterium]MBT3718081.1 GntR family transcriptional regulator [Gammaproteobacteria bacterium]MBT3845124.1 GntR family transcriptional regulator [Gammaproteobacteria bacterium]MBT3893490.1 GntR family transcriptional regulator [Gammaproteobacteria bacterium]
MGELADAATVADRVFDSLCDAIVSGKIAAGSKISEPELAKRFDVSRASLREAIGRLEACNLVNRRPRVGARVVELSLHELLEIYRVREALEGMAARLAAEFMSDKELNDLKALLEDELQLDSGNSNHDFHYAIVQGSQNRRLSHLLCDDLYHLMRMYRYQLGRDSGRASTASKEHGLILDALQDRDGEMAELLMRRHIRKSRAYIEKMIMPRSQGD